MPAIPVDFECTAWPDTWFGINITPCCVEHDLGGTDIELFWCVIETNPVLFPVALVMLVGLWTLRPLYKLYLARKGSSHD